MRAIIPSYQFNVTLPDSFVSDVTCDLTTLKCDNTWTVDHQFIPTTKRALILPFILENIAISIDYTDWFLPSKDELNKIYEELYLNGVGGLSDDYYWSSSEYVVPSDQVWAQKFDNGAQSQETKSSLFCVRACRSFNSTVNYSLRDTGPAGGYIFYKSGNNYLEAAPTDVSSSRAWSNVLSVTVVTTDTAIGTGQANTTAIMNQTGHFDSAALLCDFSTVTKSTTAMCAKYSYEYTLQTILSLYCDNTYTTCDTLTTVDK